MMSAKLTTRLNGWRPARVSWATAAVFFIGPRLLLKLRDYPRVPKWTERSLKRLLKKNLEQRRIRNLESFTDFNTQVGITAAKSRSNLP